MYTGEDDIDGPLETNRLIQVSCEKIVNSRNERGGAKLHRNLMIVHLIRKARSHTMRSAVGYPYPSCAEANSFVYGSPSSDIYQNSSDCQSNPSCYSGQLRNASEHLYNAYNSSHYGHSEFSMELSDEMDYAIPLEPIKLRFVGNEVPMESGELLELKQSEVPKNGSLLYGEQQTEISSVQMSSLPHFGDELQQSTSYLSENIEEVRELPAAEDDNGCFVDDGDDEETEECQLSETSGRRKRKTSMTCLAASDSSSAKKCCVEEHQLTGLISVFNSGLTVVADQILPRTPAANLLPPASDQIVPSLMHLACSPLICK
ncbi:unnamed protein product [Dracunculus medinensis]|uniref:SERTA domain-containing protein n=1 Tax=Dracunculus medinensis TaxID=318479 RepID=A0A0N4UCM1_DRAME|nr:unnamed protein product [Dracunculus medinensis]